MKPVKLTVDEAIAQGFTHWAYNSDEPFLRKLTDISPLSFERGKEDGSALMLVNPKGYKYTISAKDIEQLVVDMICEQDEVADEDCELCDLASEADYEPIAADINLRMSKKTFYDMSDIELIQSEEMNI
jgi:hypothetical protein